MSWRDRDYNQSGGAEDYLSNPAAILSFSMPFGTWFGVRVRLHFWLLISVILSAGEIIHGNLLLVLIGVALLLAALLIHDFSHKLFAQSVGGEHNEFMLWPAGGMIFPTVPPGPWPMFLAYAGPMVVHAAIALACLLAAGIPFWSLPLNPLAGLGLNVVAPPLLSMRGILYVLAVSNWLLLMVNLLPYYWFDGGCILQSILWPMAGAHRAINITCIAGMVLAVPMLIISILHGDFLGAVLWALLFSSSFTRRRQLHADGAGEEERMIAWSAGAGAEASPRRRKWMQRGFASAVAKRAAEVRRERQKIDGILAKVSRSGMNSLTWMERRALRKATERQRKASV